jgi:hypothetical protein
MAVVTAGKPAMTSWIDTALNEGLFDAPQESPSKSTSQSPSVACERHTPALVDRHAAQRRHALSNLGELEPRTSASGFPYILCKSFGRRAIAVGLHR